MTTTGGLADEMPEALRTLVPPRSLGTGAPPPRPAFRNQVQAPPEPLSRARTVHRPGKMVNPDH